MHRSHRVIHFAGGRKVVEYDAALGSVLAPCAKNFGYTTVLRAIEDGKEKTGASGRPNAVRQQHPQNNRRFSYAVPQLCSQTPDAAGSVPAETVDVGVVFQPFHNHRRLIGSTERWMRSGRSGTRRRNSLRLQNFARSPIWRSWQGDDKTLDLAKGQGGCTPDGLSRPGGRFQPFPKLEFSPYATK